MASKTSVIFLCLCLAFVLLVSSGAASRDLAKSTKSEETNVVTNAKYQQEPQQYGKEAEEQEPVGEKPEGYGGGAEKHGGPGGEEPAVYGGGPGGVKPEGYGGRPRLYGGRGGYRRRCRYGCCRRDNYGCKRCCSYAGEALDFTDKP